MKMALKNGIKEHTQFPPAAYFTTNQPERSKRGKSSELTEAEVVLVHGYPGAGKGTQCSLLQERFGFTHISVGDLLRKEMKTNSKIAKTVRDCVMAGQIVAPENTIELLKKAMKESEVKKFLIDGYPRDRTNLNCWIDFVSTFGISVKFALLLTCDKQICKERILGNVRDNKRIDDNEETLEKRFQAYEDLMDPVHEYFKVKRKEVDGQGQNKTDTPEQVFKRVKQVFEEDGLFAVGQNTSVLQRKKMFEEDGVKQKSSSSPRNGIIVKVKSEEKISSKLGQRTLRTPTLPPTKQHRLPPKRCTVVLVHGYSGAGKGTQCGLAAKRFGFTHISVGDLMRRKMKEDGPLSETITRYVMEGKIVPAKLTCKVLKEAMEKSTMNKFLIDGYPRDDDNLKAWIDFVSENEINVEFVLRLNCDKKICERRILGNVRGSGRKDDNPDTLKKRFQAYEDLMDPVHEYFKVKRKEVDGQGQNKSDTPEQVFERVKQVFEEEGLFVVGQNTSVLQRKKMFEEDGVKQKSTPSPRNGIIVKVKSEEKISSKLGQRTLRTPTLPPTKQHRLPPNGCTVVLVHGYPGAGKRTQCWLVARRFGFTHISVGDLMRREVKKDSLQSDMIRQYVMEGKIVPAKLTCKVLKEAMEKSTVSKFLIDGYPRDDDNLKAWIDFVSENDINVKFVLRLNCDKKTCERRILGNVRGSGRQDDNPITLKKRFQAYESLMGGIHKFYENIRWEVDGEGKTTFETEEEVIILPNIFFIVTE